MLTLYDIHVCYFFYILSSHFSVTTEELITATLKVMSATTKHAKGALTTEEVITTTLKVISGTTKKVILATEEVIIAT